MNNATEVPVNEQIGLVHIRDNRGVSCFYDAQRYHSAEVMRKSLEDDRPELRERLEANRAAHGKTKALNRRLTRVTAELMKY